MLVITSAAGWLAFKQKPVAAIASGQWGQPPRQVSALNPNGYPPIAACQAVPLENPIAEAKASIARSDLRPFTIYGFTPAAVPGIFCPSGRYGMESRGGTFVSDMPDACGGNSFSAAPPERMESFNRTLAADSHFQKITGCRPSTYCEERYGKPNSVVRKRDPRCPAEPQILLRAAQDGTIAEVTEALTDFTDRSPRSRDAVTVAFLGALGRAKWDNAEALLRAGADINGRAFDIYPDKREWLGSPLEAVFNQNADDKRKIDRARWLFVHGLTFSNPYANQALGWAALGNDIDAVNFLLAKGASPNGPTSKQLQDKMARGDIQSAGGIGGGTPLYTALDQAMLKYARRTPSEAAHADAEQRKARINAVTLYQAGGRFAVGMVYDELRHDPDEKVASILLAAADREGRLKELIDRILYPAGHGVALDPGGTDGERALIVYLRKVAACPAIRPAARRDYIKLCPSSDV